MTRQPSPKQAELSSDTTSSSDESPVDIFSRQPPPGAEQEFTLDTVQQYPHQTAEVGSMNEGVHPMPYAAGVNYPQGYFPSLKTSTDHFIKHSRPFLFSSLITSAEREVKDSRRSGMYQSCNFLTRLGKQSL